MSALQWAVLVVWVGCTVSLWHVSGKRRVSGKLERDLSLSVRVCATVTMSALTFGFLLLTAWALKGMVSMFLLLS